MDTKRSKRSWMPLVAALGVCIALVACNNRDEGAGGRRDAASPTPAAETASGDMSRPGAGPKASIMRPSVIEEAEPTPPPRAPEPFRASVGFEFGEATLSAEAKAVLDRAVQAAAATPAAKVVIRGNSDSKGDDAKNRLMSAQRADAVRAYLAEHGVAEDRLETFALGETRPAAPNARLDGTDNEEGRQRNRRVDILIAAPAPAAAAPQP